jgi:hypothetical protein
MMTSTDHQSLEQQTLTSVAGVLDGSGSEEGEEARQRRNRRRKERRDMARSLCTSLESSGELAKLCMSLDGDDGEEDDDEDDEGLDSPKQQEALVVIPGSACSFAVEGMVRAHHVDCPFVIALCGAD